MNAAFAPTAIHSANRVGLCINASKTLPPALDPKIACAFNLKSLGEASLIAPFGQRRKALLNKLMIRRR
jgi:hypothetical protein